jgi:hypothetical protein
MGNRRTFSAGTTRARRPPGAPAGEVAEHSGRRGDVTEMPEFPIIGVCDSVSQLPYLLS